MNACSCVFDTHRDRAAHLGEHGVAPETHNGSLVVLCHVMVGGFQNEGKGFGDWLVLPVWGFRSASRPRLRIRNGGSRATSPTHSRMSRFREAVRRSTDGWLDLHVVCDDRGAIGAFFTLDVYGGRFVDGEVDVRLDALQAETIQWIAVEPQTLRDEHRPLRRVAEALGEDAFLFAPCVLRASADRVSDPIGACWSHVALRCGGLNRPVRRSRAVYGSQQLVMSDFGRRPPWDLRGSQMMAES